MDLEIFLSVFNNRSILTVECTTCLRRIKIKGVGRYFREVYEDDTLFRFVQLPNGWKKEREYHFLCSDVDKIFSHCNCYFYNKSLIKGYPSDQAILFLGELIDLRENIG
ncbi:MAG: hypothetical protein WBA13_06830 [Microcoleaceae cyanobacterium]